MSLIDLSNISKPADTLIKKISGAIGGLAKPWQIRRIAEAEADAEIFAAKADIQKKDLYKRAEHRRLVEEAGHQKNMENVTAKALTQLKEDADPNAVEDDWIANFFDKSRIISDNDMQTLWARVLAGEANAPGTYSKRTVNFLSDMDKRDAELFSTLCGFVWLVEDHLWPLVLKVEAKIYSDQGITFNSLEHLDSIGLIRFADVGEYIEENLPRIFEAHYCGTSFVLKIPDYTNSLRIGYAQFTRIGKELVPISGSCPVDGFRDYVKEMWAEYSPKENFGSNP